MPVLLKDPEFDELDDQNGIERASEQRETTHLKSILILVDEIDLRDGIHGNDLKLNQVRNLANNCFDENNKQLNCNWRQQRVIDSTVMGQKDRPPLEAA